MCMFIRILCHSILDYMGKYVRPTLFLLSAFFCSCFIKLLVINFSRTLTAVHDAILEDLCFPSEIVGKRIRIKLDGTRLIKVHLDKAQQTNVEHKVNCDTFFAFSSSNAVCVAFYIFLQPHIIYADECELFYVAPVVDFFHFFSA